VRHADLKAPPSHGCDDDSTFEDRVRRRLKASRARYERSWLQALAAQLKTLDFVSWTTIFGAELLWSALPFTILLSSLANESIDDDLSRHIGLNREGARIVRSLFRGSPAHAVVPIVTGLLFTFVGVIAVVGSLGALYERAFEVEHRGWRELPRYLALVAVLFGVLVFDSLISGPERRAAGPLVEALVTFVVVAIAFTWTIHFLLGGRVPWRRVLRPALLTALLWVGFAFFSSAYFSSVAVDDTRTYGTIGVVFTFLTWFILIGSVIVLGAAGGTVWQQRKDQSTRPSSSPQPAPATSVRSYRDS
jgi:membrane protein